ncbi:hypothetical protein [Nesterenkonia alba]|nr:hypothetical protein [Nesterenkonia alba]
MTTITTGGTPHWATNPQRPTPQPAATQEKINPRSSHKNWT